MGRSRSYDQDAVLSGAVHAFRHKGYQAVSIRDLEDATGLKAGSIYNSFGDKAGLFDAAFAHYNRTVLAGRIARHAPVEAGLDGLCSLFTSLLHEPDEQAFGCLITNAAVELGGAAPHRGVEQGLGMLVRLFTDRLEAAERAGDLRADVVPGNAAVKLLALYQGLLVLIRAGHNKSALKRLISNEFKELEAQHDA